MQPQTRATQCLNVRACSILHAIGVATHASWGRSRESYFVVVCGVQRRREAESLSFDEWNQLRVRPRPSTTPPHTQTVESMGKMNARVLIHEWAPKHKQKHIHPHTSTHSETKTNKMEQIVADGKVVPPVVKVGHAQFPEHINLFDAEHNGHDHHCNTKHSVQPRDLS